MLARAEVEKQKQAQHKQAALAAQSATQAGDSSDDDIQIISSNVNIIYQIEKWAQVKLWEGFLLEKTYLRSSIHVMERNPKRILNIFEINYSQVIQYEILEKLVT